MQIINIILLLKANGNSRIIQSLLLLKQDVNFQLPWADARARPVWWSRGAACRWKICGYRRSTSSPTRTRRPPRCSRRVRARWRPALCRARGPMRTTCPGARRARWAGPAAAPAARIRRLGCCHQPLPKPPPEGSPPTPVSPPHSHCIFPQNFATVDARKGQSCWRI